MHTKIRSADTQATQIPDTEYEDKISHELCEVMVNQAGYRYKSMLKKISIDLKERPLK